MDISKLRELHASYQAKLAKISSPKTQRMVRQALDATEGRVKSIMRLIDNSADVQTIARLHARVVQDLASIGEQLSAVEESAVPPADQQLPPDPRLSIAQLKFEITFPPKSQLKQKIKTLIDSINVRLLEIRTWADKHEGDISALQIKALLFHREGGGPYFQQIGKLEKAVLHSNEELAKKAGSTSCDPYNIQQNLQALLERLGGTLPGQEK